MKQLIVLLEDLGLRNVKTYLQSGNAFFQSQDKNAAQLSGKISAGIKKRHGFEPEVLSLKPAEMGKAAKSNPFPEAESVNNTLHLFFLASAPSNPDLRALESVRSRSEHFVLKGKVLYLHAPDGVGRSQLAANAEKALGVPITGRNWRTVSEIIVLSKGYH